MWKDNSLLFSVPSYTKECILRCAWPQSLLFSIVLGVVFTGRIILTVSSLLLLYSTIFKGAKRRGEGRWGGGGVGRGEGVGKGEWLGDGIKESSCARIKFKLRARQKSFYTPLV